ncbi:MAG: DUF6318 family protein [Actinomycetes bacterium]
MSRGGAAGLLVVSALVLGACSDGEAQAEPSTSPSLSVTATQTPTVTSTEEIVPEPTMPPEAREQTAEGAAAFVRYWFDLVNYGYATGDTEPLELLSHPDCATCKSIADQINGRYGKGGRFDDGVISVGSAEATVPDERGAALVTVGYKQEALKELSRTGVVENSGTPEQGTLAVYVLSDGAWTVFGIADE